MRGRIGHVSVVVMALALLVLGGLALAQRARAGGIDPTPVPAAPPSAAPQSRYDGRLGVMFSTHLDAEGRAVTRIDGDGLTVVRTATAFGEVKLELMFKKDRVELSLGPDGVRVERGRTGATLNPRRLTEADLARAERVVRGSQAVRAFKQLTAQIELNDAEDDGFTLGALVDGALVRILDGEVGVVHRLRNRLQARRRAGVRQASFEVGAPQFEDCLGKYELTLDLNWHTFMGCVDDAGDAAWYLRHGLAIGCEIEWIIRAETAMFQFASCAAIPM